ncbi:MAG TPA: PA0069 family radical SAM protein [bacterium]|nr:PA0069 family radical SAM protein [bacterium]
MKKELQGKKNTRGTTANPANRFEKLHYEYDERIREELPARRTTFLRDATSSIITYNDSPDVGFDASLNVYRGCEHGCAYCYARPTHEYLGFSAGLDFESKILVKENAPELLRQELSDPNYNPQVLAMSGVTDPYQPIERQLQLTRKCLQVLTEFRNPVAIVTKNYLVTRDIDLLERLASFEAATVYISITTLDNQLRGELEPRTSPVSKRLDILRTLTDAHIPCGVLIAPVIPGLTDHEIPSILTAAADTGAQYAGYIMLRLPFGVKDLFEQWLEDHFPDRKAKVLHRIQAVRDGRLNDPRFGSRMRGEGIYADQVDELFTLGCDRANLGTKSPPGNISEFRRPNEQLSMFHR